ncbi:MAG: MerR family transcriptional regulator [Candidatus Aminicenantes bacterium]|nr:MerR family transcriptional regulator [Candidatus Aminicenantes bacterium]
MKKEIFSRTEVLERAGVADKTLAAWEGTKLIRADGATNGGVPFYTRAAFDRIVQIRKLVDLGYGPEAIAKIVKKIGLPRSEEAAAEKSKSREYLTVGGLAERIGTSPRAIKHWEDKGIIEPDMRSEGGFRLYADHWVYLCKLILDLQLFGYSLEEIKVVSGLFRDILAIETDPSVFSPAETARKLDEMLARIDALFAKMNLFKQGIERWEDLLKKKRKEIHRLKDENAKSPRAHSIKDRPRP